MVDFVSLHTHADTSLLDGFGRIPEYIERTVELGQKGLGITDHGSTGGLYSLITQAKKAGITPIPGCEFYVAPENPLGARVKEPIFYSRGFHDLKSTGDSGDKDVSGAGKFLHLSVWAINQTGLINLFKLSTKSFHPDNTYGKPRIDFNMLVEHSEGLVVATGCPSSEISTRLRLGQKQKAYEYTSRLVDVFGDRLYVEVMNHNMKQDLERSLLTQQRELAQHFNLPFLATNDCHYVHQHDGAHHEEMLASQSGSTMFDKPKNEGGKRFAFDGREYYMKSADQMASLFPEHDYPGALSNTVAIAEMATDIHLKYDASLMPRAIIDPSETPLSVLKRLINEGFKEKYKNATQAEKDEAIKRVKYELEMFKSLNFVEYLLVALEAVDFMKKEFALIDPTTGEVLVNPVGVGRGSGAGVLIAYLLGITGVNPLKHNLFVERFMSPGRGDTARVTYDDGSYEDVVIAEVKTLATGEKKYIHQLEPGDEIINDNNTKGE